MIPHHSVGGREGAETIVFSHSLGASEDMWRPQVEALADRFRLVRYDTRGHGRTRSGGGAFDIRDLADDIADLLDHLEVERAHLVGISLGGATVLDFAARHRERTDRIAVIGTAVKPGSPAYWAERVKLVRTRGMAAVAETATRRWFTDRFHSEHPDIVKRFRRDIAACDPLGYTACCRALAETDLRDELGDIEAPALVLYGDQDTVATEADARVLEAGIRDCRIAAVEGAAHIASTEQAEAVNRLLLEHLNG
ncbi:alpha/beta fold hydrolase [Glycomyces sp. NRRL B-16210]|uniref:alpha/beta fold hydrolase n=1 Tax=Glycomyces sp. NRRL B-16210 TaxID=1463821 RepID=UPI0004BFF29A|nr:alpha/beta fold hydrolase [Glycomyces sp. NRRL B-16210]